MGSEKSDLESKAIHHDVVAVNQVDEAAQLSLGGGDIDPREASRVRKKIDKHIIPIMCGELLQTYRTELKASSNPRAVLYLYVT
jgi:hypothetical protein